MPAREISIELNNTDIISLLTTGSSRALLLCIFLYIIPNGLF